MYHGPVICFNNSVSQIQYTGNRRVNELKRHVRFMTD
jgi:hypothetical protein